MKLHLSRGSSRQRLARSRWLSLALVTLLSLSSAGVAAQRGSGFVPMFSARAAAITFAPAAGLLYTVDSTGDGGLVGPSSACDDGTGKCTLRAAIQAANAHAGDDGIEISIPATEPNCDATGRCTINLTSPLPSLSTNIDIVGPGALKLTVQRNSASVFRIFDVTNTGTVTLSGMLITGGNTSGTGGGIQNNNGGTVNIINCILWTNHGSGNGGAIYNSGAGTVNVTNSELLANSAALGAGIFNNGTGTINITNSTVTENTGTTGGALFNNSTGTVNITNSTLARNSASTNGGGMFNNGTGIVSVKSTIIASNTGNSSTPDVSGTFNSPGFNLIGIRDGSTGFTAATDQTGTVALPLDPQLDPFQTGNGGQTQTIRLRCGSPAIDKGTSVGLTGNLTTDQRGTGFPRIFDDPGVANATGGDGADIGAFERQQVCNQQLVFSVNTTGDADDVNPGDRICDADAGAAGQQCSLRAALKETNLLANDDTISLVTINFSIPTTDPGHDPATGRYTINLTGELPFIVSNLTLNGPGPDVLTVRRNIGGDYGIFNVSSNVAITVTISGMTISNGKAGGGGGINSPSLGTLNVTNCNIIGNSAISAGGGVAAAGTLNVTDSMVSGNLTDSQGSGGGIYSSSTMHITNSTISGNSAGIAGAIYASRSVTINNSKLTNNSAVGSGAYGGAIVFGSFGMTLSVINSTISGNTARSFCGGICNFPLAGSAGTVNVINSTISGNSAQFNSGGGMANSGGTLNVTNSTIAGNSAGSPGGGIYNENNGILNITNSTVTGNSAGQGGGIAAGCCTANVRGSIIALNTASGGSPDVSSAFTSGGFNLIGKADGSTGFTNGVNNDQVGTSAAPLEPKLDPAGLRNNGGPTATIALFFGSPAIDKGTSAGLTGNLTTDQRGTGFPRTFNDPNVANATGGDGTDIGAFEFGGVRIDIDGNNNYDALTDGLLIIRYLFGLTGTSLTNGAIGALPTRTTPTEIVQFLDSIKPALDVDGNSQSDALTDGLMLIRYLFGLRGSALTTGAIGTSATRTTGQIETYIQSLMP